jgi:hypothetical protein
MRLLNFIASIPWPVIGIFCFLLIAHSIHQSWGQGEIIMWNICIDPPENLRTVCDEHAFNDGYKRRD